jgi:hypothetical protein
MDVDVLLVDFALIDQTLAHRNFFLWTPFDELFMSLESLRCNLHNDANFDEF